MASETEAGTGSDTGAESSPVGPGKRKLTADQFKAAATLWKQGRHTADQIIAKLGLTVTRQRLGQIFKKRGIVFNSEPFKSQEEIAAEIQRKMEAEAAEKAARIKDTKDEHYKLGQATRRLLAKKIIALAQGTETPAVAYGAIKTIRLAQDTLNKNADHAWLVLGLDKNADLDEELPNLQITELTAAEIAEIQAQQVEGELEIADGLEDGQPDPTEDGLVGGDDDDGDEDDEVVAEE